MLLRTLILFIACIFLFGCNAKEENANNGKTENEKQEAEISNECYRYTNGKDSILLSFQQKENQLEGWLNYNFYEKDNSIGKVKGQFSGDTLQMEYDFLSEGMISKQQIFFLKKENRLYRGIGHLKMIGDSLQIYSNKKEVDYNDYTPLEHLKQCPESFIKQENKELFMKIKEEM